MVTYDDFRKLELKIATIKDVVPHPQADRLYVLTVDNGTAVKQVVAGIRLFYDVEKLKGRQVVIVDNLEPAIIRGVESQGMILAATDEAGVSAIMPDRAVKEGSIVK